MTAAALAAFRVAEEKGPELPVSPVTFGLIALVVFAALFAVTWAFRNVAKKR